MPMPEDFEAECLYTPDAWFLTDIEIHAEDNRIVGTVDTNALGPLVDAQRTWPGHPKHFPAAIAVQITGVLGQLFAVYVLGLRATEGWVGYGTHIHEAKFARMGTIGSPVSAQLVATKVRTWRGTTMTKFTFTYTQDGHVIYRSQQSAAWVRTDHRGPLTPTNSI